MDFAGEYRWGDILGFFENELELHGAVDSGEVVPIYGRGDVLYSFRDPILSARNRQNTVRSSMALIRAAANFLMPKIQLYAIDSTN